MFSAVERLIAGRYLRPRREEGFISVIAAFSLLGITLGVGTLIVVLAVMSGYRAELLGLVLGFNSHVVLQTGPEGLPDFDALAEELRSVDAVTSVTPLVTGHVMATSNGAASVSGGSDPVCQARCRACACVRATWRKSDRWYCTMGAGVSAS